MILVEGLIVTSYGRLQRLVSRRIVSEHWRHLTATMTLPSSSLVSWATHCQLHSSIRGLKILPVRGSLVQEV